VIVLKSMPEYQCDSCNYKFEATRKPSMCPYCGKTGVVKPVMTAEKLMEEISIDEN